MTSSMFLYDSCSGQIPIFIRIVTRISLHQDRPEQNSKPSIPEDHLSQAWGEKPEHLPEITSARSEEKARLPPKHHFSLSFIQMYNFGESILRVGSPDPHNTNTLQSLPPPLLVATQQWDSAICGVNHIVTSLPHFKRYNASNLTQVIMNGDGYFCMSITTTKRDDLGSYKRITTCKSCDYGDQHNSH